MNLADPAETTTVPPDPVVAVRLPAWAPRPRRVGSVDDIRLVLAMAVTNALGLVGRLRVSSGRPQGRWPSHQGDPRVVWKSIIRMSLGRRVMSRPFTQRRTTSRFERPSGGGVRLVAAERPSLMAKQDPSPRQREIVEAVEEHGSVAAAAAALSIPALTVDRALSGHHQRVRGRRVGELEAEVARLRDKVEMDQAAHRLERIVGRIERAVTPVSHRRLAHGGSRVSQQRRASDPSAA